MKQYTTPEQTAKLIELGFEKPKNRLVKQRFDRSTSSWIVVGEEGDYSIGELIDLIPDTGSEFMRNRQIFGNGVKFYCEHCIYDFDEEVELIDNLFNLVVRLKEEGVI